MEARPLLILTGELDHHTAGQLREVIQGLNLSDDRTVFFDLNGLEYVDSGGFAVFFDLVRALAGGRLGIVAPRPSVSRLIHITGLDGRESVQMYADMDAARSSLSAS